MHRWRSIPTAYDSRRGCRQTPPAAAWRTADHAARCGRSAGAPSVNTRAGTSARRFTSRYRAAAVVAVALLAWAATTRAEVVFQRRHDLGIGSNPSAFTLLPGSPGVLLVANADGIAAYH